jgi:D-glycero-D-manno-heptose 1,7-bisphosphate phosphatase
MKQAVFLDRDGTVNEEVGYLRDVAKLKLIPGAGSAIRKLNEAGFLVVLVTNQAGVARGYFPESLIAEVHARLDELLHAEDARLDAVYYCPHHPTAGTTAYTRVCDCRKPGTGLIKQATRDLHIDVKHSYMVGDKWSDVELGQRAGTAAVLVKSGYAPDDPGNVRPPHVREPEFIAHDISEAADWIIAHSKADRS